MAQNRASPWRGCWKLRSNGCDGRQLLRRPSSARLSRSHEAVGAHRPTGRTPAAIRRRAEDHRPRRCTHPVRLSAKRPWRRLRRQYGRPPDSVPFPDDRQLAPAHLLRNGPVTAVPRARTVEEAVAQSDSIQRRRRRNLFVVFTDRARTLANLAGRVGPKLGSLVGELSFWSVEIETTRLNDVASHTDRLRC